MKTAESLRYNVGRSIGQPFIDAVQAFYSTPLAFDHAAVQQFFAHFDEITLELAVESAWIHYNA